MKPPSCDLPCRVNTEQLNFEAALQELETLVEQLERGELTLEQSLERFERGVQLTRRCQQALQQAEQRVMALTQPGTSAPLTPFESDPAG
ncbi:MAG: exodeoxyribonuclease VII small subunit [Candidatus Macondimonas sp.]